MSSFEITRPRDAFGVIRGFVYQVDITIRRWLYLSAQEILELERGEDVDTVAGALCGDQDANRKLEQIKYRSKSITLRSEETIEALVNAVEHLNTNQQLSLYFQFTTNASAGTERLTPVPGGIPAIMAWEDVRLGRCKNNNETELFLSAIKSLLADRSKPKAVSDESWRLFRQIVEAHDNALLNNLVRKFSWSCRVPDAVTIKDALLGDLIALGHAADRQIAMQQYQRLFLFVLERLSQQGIKRLTVSELKSLLALPELGQEKALAIASVFDRISAIEERFKSIIERQITDRAELEDKISELAKAQGIPPEIKYVVATPTLRPASIPIHYSRRQNTVISLKSLVVNHTWVELYGGPGIGKSELARLLAESAGGISAWLDLRSLDANDACIALDQAVKAVIGDFLSIDRYLAYERFIERVGKGVLVIDDLPKFSGGCPFAARVLDLLNACQKRTVRLITTTLIKSPNWLVERIQTNLYIAVSAPPFSINEAQELFNEYGAPARWLQENIITTINATAGGHPTLLNAGIRYLKGRRWEIDQDEFLDLIRGDFFTELRRETVQKLVQLVSDPETRDLLYRANIAMSSLSENDIIALAAVDKSIPRPTERLMDLVDVCLQKTPNGRLRVSPIFKLLGTSDVPERTTVNCHAVLGASIMNRTNISITEAAAAISHFFAAREHDRAAIVLLRSLINLNSLDGRVDSGLLILFWHDQPMPDSIDLGLRIAIRANQVRIYHKADESVDYAINDLEELMNRAADKDKWAVMIAGVTVLPVLIDTDLRRANRLLLRSLHTLPQVNAVIKNDLPQGLPMLESLLWVSAAKICKRDDLDNWISTVDLLTPEERRRLFIGDLADDGCWHIADRIWLAEAELSTGEQNWNSVIETLSLLALAGQRWQKPLLEACAIRSQIVVMAEYQRNMSAALKMAEVAIKDKGFRGKAAYAIRECIGRQFKYQNEIKHSRQWFCDALLDLGDLWPEKKIGTLLNLASVSDLPAAVDRLSEAAQLGINPTNIDDLERVRVHGELALAQLKNGHQLACLQSVDIALDYLVATEDEQDTIWRSMAAVLGHYISYFTSMVTIGKPPEHSADGTPFAEPRLGMLTTVNLKLATWLTDSKISFLMGLVASMAEHLEQDVVAERRALQSLELAKKKNELLIIASMGVSHAIALIVSDHYVEALDLSLQSAGATKAISILRTTGGDIYSKDRTAEQVIGTRPSSAWKDVEYQSLIIAMFPIIMRLAIHKVNANPNTRSMAQEVISAIDIVIQNSSDRDIWIVMEEIITQTFINPTSSVALNKIGNEQNVYGRPSLQAMAYIAATLQEDMTPENALINQLFVFAESRFIAPPDWPVYRRLVIPFIEAFWSQIFMKQSFRFTPPALYRDLFTNAQAEPLERRMQAILRLGFEGLGIPVPQKYREWLAGS